MTLPRDFIGVDVSKDWIDAFWLLTGRREGGVGRILMRRPRTAAREWRNKFRPTRW